MSLPPFSEVTTDLNALTNALSILFEASSILKSKLAPEIHQHLSPSSTVTNYHLLVYAAIELISSWDRASKAEFIAGHPRIGEKSNLSALSEKEQAAAATPPEVLARLEWLNAYYEKRYPGLRYITFVDGRSRAEIAEEMEEFLGVKKEEVGDEARLRTVEPIDGESAEWETEVNRAVVDVGKIGQSRVKALGAE